MRTRQVDRTPAVVERPAAVDALAVFPGVWAYAVGPKAEVAALLKRAHEVGRLVSMTPPRPAGRGEVLVNVRLLPLKRSARRRFGWRPSRRLVWACAIAAAVVAVLALAVVWVAQWVASHAAVIVAVLVGAFLLWLAAGRAGVCPGIHCPGCRHR